MTTGRLAKRELAWLVAPTLLLAGCLPRPGTPPRGEPSTRTSAGDLDPVAVETTETADRPERDSVAPGIAAIIDSIETIVEDSIARAQHEAAAVATRDSAISAARRDSIEAARRDSIAAVARADSLAAAARRDSVAAQARRDSIAAAQRDSVAAVARQDSIDAAVRDSTAAQAHRDSVEFARQDSLIAARASAPISEDLDQLRELGPTYLPNDRGPRPVWDTELEAVIRTSLLPVVRAEELPARTTTFFWVLVRADGTVDDVVLQTSSGSDAFDEAAIRAAHQLLFAPAIRGDRPVPTWVIREVSLLMQPGGGP